MTKPSKTVSQYYKDIVELLNKPKMEMPMKNQNLKTGDLVHIPSEVYRFRSASLQLDFFSDINKTHEPMIGLFKRHLDNGQCVVAFNDGEWSLPLRYVYQINKEDKCA
mgnify:CR=1 FL=1